MPGVVSDCVCVCVGAKVCSAEGFKESDRLYVEFRWDLPPTWQLNPNPQVTSHAMMPWRCAMPIPMTMLCHDAMTTRQLTPPPNPQHPHWNPAIKLHDRLDLKDEADVKSRLSGTTQV